MKFLAAVMIVATGAAAPAADGPGDAALTFLRGLNKDNAVFVVGDTAISPDIPADHRADIAARLSRLGRGIRPEDLRVIDQKEDGDLAAVLVSQVTNYDANSVQIHAVGMVKSAEKWLPAPLPSSFNSTGLSLRPGLLQRAKVLENWMLQARSQQLVRLKDDIFSLLFDEMRKVKSPDELHESTPEKLAADFLKALKDRNLPAALALVGGLENPRPTDWEDTFQALSRTLRRTEMKHLGWRLLAAPEAARAIVSTEQNDNDGLVSIVALDPAADFQARPRPQAIHLPFVRSKAGLWRIRLPHELLAPVTRKTSPGNEEDDAVDAGFIADFPKKLHGMLGSKRETTARAAAEGLLAALREPSVEAMCSRLDLEAEPDLAVDALGRSARLWQRLHHPDDVASPVLLEVQEAGDDACALVQVFSAKIPEKAAVEAVYFQRTEAGWLANPGFSGTSAAALANDNGALNPWFETAMQAREANWANGVLTRIGGIPADSAPSEEGTRRLMEDWRKAIAHGDGAAVLAMSACFDDDAGANRLLRNTGYELLSRHAGEILGVHRSGRWAAVSLRVPPAPGDDSADAYPLYVVAATASGPRVLPELDLFDPLTSTRNFLNRKVWERIAARLPDGARGELETIYEKHRTLSAADRERRLKPTE